MLKGKPMCLLISDKADIRRRKFIRGKESTKEFSSLPVAEPRLTETLRSPEPDSLDFVNLVLRLSFMKLSRMPQI